MQPVSGFSLVLLKRFEEAIQPIKEGLRRNEDVPYGLNALGNMSEAKEFKRLEMDLSEDFCGKD